MRKERQVTRTMQLTKVEFVTIDNTANMAKEHKYLPGLRTMDKDYTSTMSILQEHYKNRDVTPIKIEKMIDAGQCKLAVSETQFALMSRLVSKDNKFAVTVDNEKGE